jgi:hypothetical protein
MNFTITLSAAQTGSTSVDFSTANGTASAGSDYSATSGTVVFAPGETSKTISVSVMGDTTLEQDEGFSVVLSNPVGAVVANAVAQGAILNDDYSLSINDVSVSEGNNGTRAATFTVTISSFPRQTVTVQYSTSNGTATAGSDYQSTSGTVTFAPGEAFRERQISIPIVGDRLPEPNESFVLNLTNPTNATIADAQGLGTINDDEPRISISDVTRVEGKKNTTTQFIFTVTLSVAYDQAVTMSFMTTDGTAKTSDQDYVAKTGTITFNPGETSKTITIVVNGDNKKESDEVFYLDLFGNSSNSLFTKSRGVGTILNDD